MKTFIILIAAAVLVSFSHISYEPKQSTAEVNQVQGLYIFTDSKPVQEFEYLGTVKTGMTMHAYYSEVKDNLIKRTKKDYPFATGIIIASNMETADIIRFK